MPLGALHEGLPVRLDAHVPEGPGRQVVLRGHGGITELAPLPAGTAALVAPHFADDLFQVGRGDGVLAPQLEDLQLVVGLSGTRAGSRRQDESVRTVGHFHLQPLIIHPTIYTNKTQ